MTCCRCALDAEAWMTFDYPSGHIEIRPMPADLDRYGGYAMCEIHANRLRPPIGWRLTDWRESALTLFPLPGSDETGDVGTAPSSDVA